MREILVRMWSHPSEESGSDVLSPEDMTSLLMTVYRISMDHYSEGPQMCLSCNKTLKAVVDSCFHMKKSLSAQFVTHWIETNIPRLLFPMHRFTVHTLATSWRTLDESEPTPAIGKIFGCCKFISKIVSPYIYFLKSAGFHIHSLRH